jgi:hypothetical protein
MHHFADIESLKAGRSVVEVPEPEAAIRALYDQIAREGVDTPLLAYPRDGHYAVVDDRLRLDALQRLRRDGKLPRSIEDHGVPVVLLEQGATALFSAADRVVRTQVDAAAEALYLKHLFRTLDATPPTTGGAYPRLGADRVPAAQQPGRTGLLCHRYRWNAETARRAVRRSEVPEPVLLACLGDETVTRRALTAAGTAINQNPDRDPETLAWEKLASTAGRPLGTSDSDAGAPGNGMSTGGETAQTDNANLKTKGAAAQPAGTPGAGAEGAVSGPQTTQGERSKNGSYEQVVQDPRGHGLKLAKPMNRWPRDVRKPFLAGCLNNLTAEALADVRETLRAVSPRAADARDADHHDGDRQPHRNPHAPSRADPGRGDDRDARTQAAADPGPA